MPFRWTLLPPWGVVQRPSEKRPLGATIYSQKLFTPRDPDRTIQNVLHSNLFCKKFCLAPTGAGSWKLLPNHPPPPASRHYEAFGSLGYRARVREIVCNIGAEVCLEAKVPETVRQRKPMTSMPDDEISLFHERSFKEHEIGSQFSYVVSCTNLFHG